MYSSYDDWKLATPPDGGEVETEVVCELCDEVCTDNFELIPISHSISICVCKACAEQGAKELDHAINYLLSYRKRNRACIL